MSALTLTPCTTLSSAEHAEIRALSLAVYPPEAWADWPGRDIEWSTPEWCVRLRSEDSKLASFVGVYVRECVCDERAVTVGGIGNVKTHPAARGRGYASLGIRRAVEFFREQPRVDFALLVCAPHLIGYYGRLGWRAFGGRLLVRQRGEVAEFTLDRVMVHPVRSEGPTVGVIDLCGPPW